MSSAAASRPQLRRVRQGRVVAGVCAGLGERFGIDPIIVRLAFIAAATAGGFGLLAYAVLYVALPDDRGGSPVVSRLPRTGRGAVEVAAGAGLLVLSVLLVLRETGIWFSDAVVWPVVLVAAGGALIWRSSERGSETLVAAEGTPAATLSAEQTAAQEPAEVVRERAGILSRTGLGIALVIAAALVFLQATGALAAARDVALSAVVVAVALGVIFAPWVLRLVRSLSAERNARIRSQERAEVAAHLHDSVLQTLALVQKRADDPRAVATLARQQERELRAWLSGRTERDGSPRIAAALEAVAGEVERAHGVPVEVVVVGDRDLDERGEALLAAAREAMVNAAKFGGMEPVSVYLEADEQGLHAFVRDRGPGFEPAAVPEDRRGVRESIVGRMQRHGGRASIQSSPETGTEVELEVPA